MTPNLVAFLAMIARCEVGTTAAIGYRTLYGGGTFDSFADHPRRPITAGRYTSTAAGRYQALAGTWDDFCRAKGKGDFSPARQDQFAVWCITRRGALADVEAGRIPEAIAKCGKEWASLPGSPYGQPVRTLAECLGYYKAAGGQLATNSNSSATAAQRVVTPVAPARKAPVDPLTATLFSTIVQSLPDIFKAFGGKEDSPKAAIVERVAQVATTALGVGGPGAALDALQGPEAAANVAKVAEAVKADPVLTYALTEVGGGVIAARKAAQDYVSGLEDDEWWRMVLKLFVNPVHLVTAAAFYLVWIFVTGLVPQLSSLSSEVVAGTMSSVISLLLGAVMGFWMGQTYKQSKE